MYRAYDIFRWRRHIPSVTDYERSRKGKTTLPVACVSLSLLLSRTAADAVTHGFFNAAALGIRSRVWHTMRVKEMHGVVWES